MAGEPSATGAVVQAEAVAIDAAANAAETARLAAEAAVAHAASAAANAEAQATERTAQIEQRTAEELAQQEDRLSWLKTHATETTGRLENLSSVLTKSLERQSATETLLTGIMERLTPPALPEPPAEQPTAPANVEENRGSNTGQAGKKHRWI